MRLHRSTATSSPLFAGVKKAVVSVTAVAILAFSIRVGAAQDQPSVPDQTVMPPPEQTPAMQPLQGSVEQTRREKRETSLKGGANSSEQPGLTGGAQSGPEGILQPSGPGAYGTPNGQPMQGYAGQNPFPLSASGDPDEFDQQLQIDWDAWRNRLIQAIQMSTLAKINVHNDVNFVLDPRRRMMVSRYPLGLSAWYSCDVLPNGRIINIRLTQSSQFPSFDQALMQSIWELQGNSILVYPRGSRRQSVTQEASVRTAGETQTQNVQFGDVETQRTHHRR